MNGNNTVFLFKGLDSNWSERPENFHNRGFLFGDGLFETMVLYYGKIRFGEFHHERLLEGCRILKLEVSELSAIDMIESELVRRFGTEIALRVRWNVFRGGEGKYTPECNLLSESLQIQIFQPSPKIKQKAYFSDSIFVPKSPWSHCKTLSALTYVMANIERKSKAMDEVFLCNIDGYVSEAGTSNIFWIKDGNYYTPSLDCSCIAGVGRRITIERLKAASISITEGKFLPDQLLESDYVFTTNVTGVNFIKQIGGRSYQTDPEFDLDF